MTTNMEPKVTGLSPMTGPPGTKITVRGENLGQSSDDIIKLTVNGADCLPYLEWKSPKKIITRCTKAKGSGDIIITTNSGGVGTCDVQFYCCEQIIGPTTESAVWIDEMDNQIPEKEKLSTPGLSHEYSADFSSNQFKPQTFLEDKSNASFEDIEKLLVKLENRRKSPQKANSAPNREVLLKSNLPVIMECLTILERLSKMIVTSSRDTSIDTIVGSIERSLTKTHELFDPLLAQRDLVQSIESAMQIFRQNETLFNLPSAIDTSIKTKNYDSVVKEISGVLSRLKTINIEQNLLDKIRLDVSTKVDKLKATIEEQLYLSCKSTNGERNIDEVKKIISHLNRLGNPTNYDVWIALKEMSTSLVSTLTERFKYFLKLRLEDGKLSATTEAKLSSQNNDPLVVQFVQSAITIFHNTYYDILTLGQSYFDPKDEFACKESDEVRQKKLTEFEETMISKPIIHLCNLLRQSLVPDSSKLDISSPWPPDESDAYVSHLRHVLQSVITCHIHLTKVNTLPSVARPALEDFKEFVFELRVRSMQILFGNATKANKNLHHQEDWVIDVDDLHGGITKLPSVFERNVIETLRFAHETIFKTSLSDEKSILKRVDVQASMKELAHSLINSFIDSLDNALIDSKEHPAESTRVLYASKDSSRVSSKYMNRLLLTICNCQYTRDQIFIRLQDEFEKLEGLKMDRVFKVCSKKYTDYIQKISDKFCRIKCTELNKSLREARTNGFEDLQINLMVVNSQIFLVAPQLVNSLMTSIVNSMQKEMSNVQKL